ncbi:MAG: hypothetical protein ABJ275_04850 [Maricaulaceae bacterium]
MVEETTNILFSLNGIKDLAKALAKPFERISIIYPNKAFLKDKNRWISSITLWDNHNVGLRIKPVMNDLAERLEVGSLSFDHVMVADKRDEFFDLPEGYSKGSLPKKMTLNESGHVIESGIIITEPNGTQILIVPNAMPYTLAIRCSEITSKFFEPEYALEDYIIQTWNNVL